MTTENEQILYNFIESDLTDFHNNIRFKIDHNLPFKPLHMNCKRCLKPYTLNVPMEIANHPASDLCDDCIIGLSPEEFYAEEWNQEPEKSDTPVLDLDSSKDRLKIIREKLL